jgi:hypothetical protein
MYIGTIMMCAGAGTMTTLRTSSRESLWIACQIVYALGAGFGFQQPIIAAQTTFSARELPTAFVLISFFQTIGGIVAVSVAQSVFTNTLSTNLLSFMPDADTSLVLNTGILNLKNRFEDDELARVLPAYDRAVTRVFVVASLMAAGTAIASIGMPWRSVKVKKGPGEENA